MAWSTSSRKEQLPSNWYELRQYVLDRDQYICYKCGRPNADSVDHIIRGDDHSLSNLAAMHMNVWPYCHRTKSSSEGGKARSARRLRPTERHPGLLT